MADKFAQPGDRHIITRIVQPDYDFYAVVHYDKRWAFPCSEGWFTREQPEVGDAIVLGTDNNWHVEKVKP